MMFSKSWELRWLGPCLLHSFEGQFEVRLNRSAELWQHFLSVSEFN